MDYKDVRAKLRMADWAGHDPAEKDRLIGMVSDELNREIITMRFVKKMKWKEIEKSVHYSMKTVHRREEKGLKEIAAKLDAMEA